MFVKIIKTKCEECGNKNNTNMIKKAKKQEKSKYKNKVCELFNKVI